MRGSGSLTRRERCAAKPKEACQARQRHNTLIEASGRIRRRRFRPSSRVGGCEACCVRRHAARAAATTRMPHAHSAEEPHAAAEAAAAAAEYGGTTGGRGAKGNAFVLLQAKAREAPAHASHTASCCRGNAPFKSQRRRGRRQIVELVCPRSETAVRSRRVLRAALGCLRRSAARARARAGPGPGAQPPGARAGG